MAYNYKVYSSLERRVDEYGVLVYMSHAFLLKLNFFFGWRNIGDIFYWYEWAAEMDLPVSPDPRVWNGVR
jgi:hypothetical protein